VNLPPVLLARPPRIAARSPVERAALGYLHGNCGHCHDPAGALDALDLVLAQRADPYADSVARVRQSLLDRESRFRPHGLPNPRRVALDATSPSTLVLRLESTSPLARMPPLGVQLVDDEGVALVRRWINEERHNQEEARR
jgi:hypothetical protein